MARRALLALAASASASTASFSAALTIDADSVIAKINPLVYGCHSDLGYAHAGRGFYSQMVYVDHDQMTASRLRTN